MADIRPRPVRNLPEEPSKICAEYLLQEQCTKPNCSLLHYQTGDVTILEHDEEGGYFMVVPIMNARQLAALQKRQSRPCRFFMRGHCNRLENCHFSHELPNSSSDRKSPVWPAGRRGAPRNANSPMPSTSTSTTTSNKDTCDMDTAPQQSSSTSTTDESKPLKASIINTNWANAPEFVPSPSKPLQPKSYAQALGPTDEAHMAELSEQRLCQYTSKDGFCRYPPGECNSLHGNMCDMCQRAVLHPYNEEQRKKHHQECIKQHEKDMELSFALARSKEKSCGVCFEIVMEKEMGEQRFGILPNCNHCFCLSCIRKWRQARQFENKIIRACPECRITSDFVCPSMYWVDTKEDKDKLIDDYKNALARKDCKYFKKGSGKCPFGNKCFYLHAFPDGRKCDVGPPPRRRRRGLNPTEIDVLQQVILWDFLDDRDQSWQTLADELEDLTNFFSESEDSDWSDYELFLD